MNILSPTDWGAKVDYDQWDDDFTPDDGVALHHGGGSNYRAGREPFSVDIEAAQLRAWEQYHLGKGWRGLAYGWGVGQTGTIYRARGFNGYGAHTGDVDGDGIANNQEVVPIIFIGSGNYHDLSEAAQEAIEYIRREIILPRSPNAQYLYGHKELKGTVTSCPGPRLMTYVEANRTLSEEDDMLTAQDVWFHKIMDPVAGGERGAAYLLRMAYARAHQAAVDAAIARELAERNAATGGQLQMTDAQIAAIAAKVTERLNVEAIAEAVVDEEYERLAS